jgi:protein O-mannosyl-transferase
MGWLPPVLLVAAGALIYANSFAIPFLFDDHFEIVANPLVRQFQSPLSYLTESRGLSDLSFAINYALGGYQVWGYHLVNVAVHLCNAVLVYALALLTMRLPFFAARYRERERWLALLAAGIFLAHPLQTMAASYIVQRSESLATFFYLATVLLFVGANSAAGSGARTGLFGAAVVTGVLGVLSKQTAATLPATLFLYHFCFLRQTGQVRQRRWVLAALLVLPLAYALYLSRNVFWWSAPSGVPTAWFFLPSAGFGMKGTTPAHYLFTQFGVIVWYLRLYLLPTRQCFDYGWPLVDSFWRLDVVLPLLLLLSLAFAALLAYRRYRLATFCLGWFFITLAPTSSILPLRDAAFEHRMYLPIVGLAILTVVGGYDAARALARRAGIDPGHAVAAAGVVAGLWLAFLGGLTVARNDVYADPLRLAADSSAKAPEHWRPRNELGTLLLERGRIAEAKKALEEAVRLGPDEGPPRVQLAQLYFREGRLTEAEKLLVPVIDSPEESVAAAAYRQLGYIYAAQKQFDFAATAFGESAHLKPQWVSTHLELAHIYTRKGYWGDASREYETALRLKPTLGPRVELAAAEVAHLAGVQLYERRLFKAAARSFQQAIEHRPDYAPSHHYLALAEAHRGDWQAAENEIAAAVRLAPDDALVRQNASAIAARQALTDPPRQGSRTKTVFQVPVE